MDLSLSELFKPVTGDWLLNNGSNGGSLKMSANDKQIGGEHYNKNGEQHWDRMWRLYGRGYFIGCATKYAERYHLKNGIQDLEKSVHFLQKLIELETQELEMTPKKDYQNPYALIDKEG
jgi:hypothetical protein